ncbi:MAG: glycosyltransferase family 39 protein [Lachnospiraceae bacterium]|nr:glycosyltransferase family 39 protein [Lachnospiraceae bacterium]
MTKNKIYFLITIFALGLVAIYISMASSLNPWSKVLPHLDSAVWLRCGVGMKQGQVVYRDLFDHKGPILFLIQWLGFTITPHSLTGIWILECIFMWVTLVSFYLCARIFSDSKLVGFLAAVLSLHGLLYFYQQGNCVEEWALPFMGFSLFIFLKYLKTEKASKVHILIAGMCMACSFLLNGNLIAVWVSYVLIIAVKLIIRKQYQDLGMCVGMFTLGMMIIFSITSIVLGINGALGDFIKIYFGFNSEYAGGVTVKTFVLSILNFIYADTWFVVMNIVLFSNLLHDLLTNKKVDYRWSAFLYTAISLCLLSMSGRGYEHYGIQLVPCMIVPMVVCIEKIRCWCGSSKEFLIILAVTSIFFLKFSVDEYNEDIRWTMTEGVDNYYAGGDIENYTVVNDWIGGRWTDEQIDKWVVNDL